MNVVSWQRELRGLSGIAPTARLILGELARLADCRGVAIASIDYLIEATGRSRASIFRGIADLESAGLVRRHARRTPTGQRASRFELRIASMPINSEEAPHLERTLVLGDVEPVGRNDNEGLREAIREAKEQDWTGNGAQRVGATLLAEGTRQFWAPISHSMNAGMDFDEALSDTIALAWQVVREHADELVASKRPWGLWTSIVSKLGLRRDDLLPRNEHLVSPELLPEEVTTPAPLDGEAWVAIDDFEGPLLSLVEGLIRAGMDETTAWAGTRRIAELAASSPARCHSLASSDVRLADLGVDPRVARLWMTLLVGSRRGVTSGILDLDAASLDERCVDLVRQWKGAA